MKKIIPLILILISAACSRDDIEVRQEPKEGTPASMPAMGMGQGMGPGSIEPPPRPTVGLKWTLPKGWSESGGNGIRLATLTPPQEGEGKAEVSVVALPGDVGGELANVNRWRGQIALPPIDAGRLAAERKTTKSPAGPVMFYDFTSEGAQKSRFIVGVIKVADTTWFFKLMGDEKPAGRHKAAFIKLLEGLKTDA